MLTNAEAQILDRQDPLQSYRAKFFIPHREERPVIYFCGNSLGLQPKTVPSYVQEVLMQWQERGVEGHFSGDRPWVNYHKHLTPYLATLTGSNPHEVVAMNTLTTNLHLMLTTFYRPNSSRYKIIIEDQAFSSDQYAIASQIKLHGYDPDRAFIKLAPRHGEYTLRTEDIIHEIEKSGETLSMIMFGGVQYYTGQFFDIPKITEHAHHYGAIAGFDLAHAIGNVPLHLHQWNVDFAVWCSYKYLNSGPGNTGGAFVHERFANNPALPRLAGWWGFPEGRQFQMDPEFYPAYGAEGWQLSNENVTSMAAQLAALQIFGEAGLKEIFQKGRQLTDLLIKNIQTIDPQENFMEIITPHTPEERGSQVSLLMKKQGKAIFHYLEARGVVIDWREPDVIRAAPVPLYNTFEEVYWFCHYLYEAINTFQQQYDE